MCKLERTNDIKWVHVVHLKRPKIIKLENASTYFILFFGWSWSCFISTRILKKKILKFFTTKLQPPYLKVATTKKSFSIYITLIINLFLSKSIKKQDTNHIRQLCISKDRLISVKYWLNFTKVEN